jgi:hypothetical protein
MCQTLETSSVSDTFIVSLNKKIGIASSLTWQWAGLPWFDSIPALGPIQPRIYPVPGALPLGYTDRSVILTSISSV